ncbi:Sphinganine C(4)-monooxygenase 2 [Acorus calamus]|uniref:Sphinganine C(4)-monooxygenase 2 n=1 Tax=Acorus calamus TaxID=4465 RepID=A0AAV9C8A5_ACOCL|nr:Sphinganine C(4)-monooxygenase 2 [Acorus calamus]
MKFTDERFEHTISRTITSNTFYEIGIFIGSTLSLIGQPGCVWPQCQIDPFIAGDPLTLSKDFDEALDEKNIIPCFLFHGLNVRGETNSEEKKTKSEYNRRSIDDRFDRIITRTLTANTDYGINIFIGALFITTQQGSLEPQCKVARNNATETVTTGTSLITLAGQFGVAMLVLDTWQYFIHRALYNHPLEGLLLDTVGGALSFLVSGIHLRRTLRRRRRRLHQVDSTWRSRRAIRPPTDVEAAATTAPSGLNEEVMKRYSSAAVVAAKEENE